MEKFLVGGLDLQALRLGFNVSAPTVALTRVREELPGGVAVFIQEPAKAVSMIPRIAQTGIAENFII